MSDEIFANRVGGTIGGCRLVRKLGAGAMGVVFEAHHLALDKRVALKLLMPQLAADQSFVKRFVTEARLAAQVEHPNIVQVLNVGQDDDVYYIIMQFIEGRSLAELIARGPLCPREAAKVALQAARGLAAAHRRGIVHRDVKPENILVDDQGVARVVDMGLSKSLTAPAGGGDVASLTAPGVAMGTPNYMSPEQATEARTVDARSDIYSLGATLYHAIAGRPPFSGPSAFAIINQHINAPRPSLASRRRDVPPELDRLVARMMDRDPKKRFQTMDEVGAELKSFLLGPGGAGSTGTAFITPLADAPRAEPVNPQSEISTRVVPRVTDQGAEPRSPRRTKLYLLIGIGAAFVGLFVLGTLLSLADPAWGAFRAARQHERRDPADFDGAVRMYEEVRQKYTDSKWANEALTAIGNVERRREAKALEVFERIAREAEVAERVGNWGGAAQAWRVPDKWAGMNEQLRNTPSGKEAALRATKAHVASRACELFEALTSGRPKDLERAASYCDPRQDENARRLFLGLMVGLVKLGKGTPGEFGIDSVEIPSGDIAVVTAHFIMTYAAPKQPELHRLELHWQKIGDEWFSVAKPRAAEDPGTPLAAPAKRPPFEASRPKQPHFKPSAPAPVPAPADEVF